MQKLIYIVEDEADIMELIALKLRGGGFDVRCYPVAKDLFPALEELVPDLIMLDLMLPDMDGMELCAVLKKEERFAGIPIIMLTARVDIEDKVKGLETGADDYITKPFDGGELIARVNAVLRRAGWETHKNVLVIAHGFKLDFNRFEAFIKGKRIDLTLTEFKILQLLTKRPGWVYSRAQILDYLWGTDKIVIERSVDVHIKNLREKIGKFATMIRNIRGMGYKFDSDPED
ncbi:MAG: response regulator [Candidatus Cloacimonadaceae bacterium]|nr:response regulator [Candidatus Cloacimonadaceae bacterium]MDP3114997.1 response regulator [Candidatus Cloacimonadaceae bacterium]